MSVVLNTCEGLPLCLDGAHQDKAVNIKLSYCHSEHSEESQNLQSPLGRFFAMLRMTKVVVNSYSNQAITTSFAGIVISSFSFLRMPPRSLNTLLGLPAFSSST